MGNTCDATGVRSAYRHCIRIATEHYENFPVLSWTLPKCLRPHIAAVYAFARAADDDADELSKFSLKQAQAGLDAKRKRIEEKNFEGDPVFEALGMTMREFDLPPEPFLNLLSAFRQDTEKSRYGTFAEVLDYCSRSANPVGGIVLMLFGYRDPDRFALSDRICTALQLINFWQDTRSDYADRGRIYIPTEDLRRFSVEESDLETFGTDRAKSNLVNLIQFEVERTARMMREGWTLVGRLPLRLKLPIACFAAGGMTILSRIRADAPRPTLNDWTIRRRMPQNILRILFSAGAAETGSLHPTYS